METMQTFENLPLYTCLKKEHLPLLEQMFQQSSSSVWRPELHIAPSYGLLNDPNGLHFDGEYYHVFYQWYPFGARHGMKHWFHCKSKDLVRWQADSNLLIPDQPYEKNGCYSGNAWQNPADGKWYLYYTANCKDDNGVKIPLQGVAAIEEDGSLPKSKKNPILQGSPEGVGNNIRDPFVFNQDGQTWMLIGAESKDEKARGMLLLYKMNDPESFQYAGEVKIFLKNEEVTLGRMVECPGLIQVDGNDVLFISVIGNSNVVQSENRFACGAFVGHFNPNAGVFKADFYQPLDYGFDFYAPQSFYGRDKQPMFFAWFGNGDQNLPEDQEGWRHGLTLPRLLKIQDHHLITPIHPASDAAFPKREVSLDEDQIDSSLSLVLDEVEHVHIRLENDGKEHRIPIGKEDDCILLHVNFENNSLSIDRSQLKIPVDPQYGDIRQLPFEDGNSLELDLYRDHSFYELYVNGGRQVLSFRAYC